MTELGTVLDGKYEILKKVGQGGMSIVYLAMDNRLNKQWAVKEIKNDGSKSMQTLLKGLEREANILKNVDHPVLPRIVDIINENGVIYVIMDFVEGKPLSDVLKSDGAQKQSDVIEWGRALASALDYLHSMNPPIIYRDMKPSNVMLKPDGSVKLIDFGTAKEYIVENNADTTALGTRGYAAPEQFGDAQGRGIYNTDARTDIYNLGATLYHLVTGKNPCEPPYEIKPIRQWNPTLSSGLEQIIIKCCQPNPQDRYQSCSELLYALDHYNELDNEYKAQSKKKLAAFATMVGLSVISAGLAVIGGIKKGELRELNYSNKISDADDAIAADDYDKAIECYKEAIELDNTLSEAYIGLLDTYAYYYEADDENSSADTPAETGIKYAIKYIDNVDADVKYEIAIIYYNELQDYKTAMKYFNMVDDESNFPDETEQADYYAAICESKIKKNTNFNDTRDNIFEFENYNSSSIDDGNTSKYVNYLNIASIYVDNMEADDTLPQRIIDLLNEANEGLDENATVLSNEFPEERGVKYYTGQYSRILYSVYSYLAEGAEDTNEKQEHYLEAITAIDRYLASIDINAEGTTDSIKKSYVKYMKEEAETYVALAKLGSGDTYYDRAEEVYKKAEDSLGTDDYAADIYVSHLNYLYDRYTEKYGTVPDNWKNEGIVKITVICSNGNEIKSLANHDNNIWNSLLNKPVIAEIIANGNTGGE
ncbi:MAG: serine/threonine protein kinase [Coprococcus sp.]|nr:serine/threonine protein kinase [Coprococcus sp.]